jgi:hypothetical protein
VWPVFLWAGFSETLILHPEQSSQRLPNHASITQFPDGTKVANFRKGNVLHDAGNCPYTCALLCLCHEAYSPSAPKWRIGFGDSMPWYRSLREFLGALLNVRCYLIYGGCAWETLGSAGFTMARFANPRTATTLLFGDD